MKIVFSIIIPTYNRASNLKRCLSSLVSQDFNDFEVIVCDDGSTDHTKAIYFEFKDRLNIKYFFEQNWGGPARPRNIGLHDAAGKWVCFLDSDDWYSSNRLSTLFDLINDDYDIYYHRLMSIDQNGKKGMIFTRQIDNDNPSVDLLCSFNGVLMSSSCVRADKLKTQNIYFSEDREIIGVEDFDFWIKCGLNGFKFKFIDKKLGFYSMSSEDSISHRDQRQIKRLEALYGSYQSKLNPVEKRQSSAAFNYQKACLLVQMGLKAESSKCFKIALSMGNMTVKFRSLFRLIRLYS